MGWIAVIAIVFIISTAYVICYWIEYKFKKNNYTFSKDVREFVKIEVAKEIEKKTKDLTSLINARLR